MILPYWFNKDIYITYAFFHFKTRGVVFFYDKGKRGDSIFRFPGMPTRDLILDTVDVVVLHGFL